MPWVEAASFVLRSDTWRSWQLGGWGSPPLSPRGGWHQAWHGAGPGVINSCRVAGGGLRFSLSGSPVGGGRCEPPVTPAPLPMPAPPPQHTETTGSVLPLSLISRPSAHSSVPRKRAYRPGHLRPSRLGNTWSGSRDLGAGQGPHPCWSHVAPSFLHGRPGCLRKDHGPRLPSRAP